MTPRPELLASAMLLLLTACAAPRPISANPMQDVVASAPIKLTGALSIEDGLKEAAFNLDSAITVGALEKDDPAAACVHGVMKDLGLEGQPAAPSFVPKETTLIGQGSVLYIRAKQAQKLSGSGIAMPVGCKAQIGDFVLTAARANAKLLPGGGLLPALR